MPLITLKVHLLHDALRGVISAQNLLDVNGFQNQFGIGRRVPPSDRPYFPSLFRIASAIVATICFIFSSVSASTITLANASVPEYRTTTRPFPSNSRSADWIVCQISGTS